jgi:hypothetical protein
MAKLKHIAKETILILGPQGAGNECMANILHAHPDLYVRGRVEPQSESGKFHFGYDISIPFDVRIGRLPNLRFYPPKHNEKPHDVMREIANQSQQLVYRKDGPPLLYASHQFYDYTASIFENLKIICIMPRFTVACEKHFLANYMAKNYERDKSGPDAFMNGIDRFYTAISQLYKHNVCYIMFEDFFLNKWHHEYLHVCEFLNLVPNCESYFDIVRRFKNYG